MRFIFFFITLFFLCDTSTVFAQGIKDSGNNLNTVAQRAGTTDVAEITDVIGTFINVALTLVGIIFLVLMVYAGILWMTARGEEEQIGKARKMIIAAVIGLVITVSAYAITIFVTGRFGT